MGEDLKWFIGVIVICIIMPLIIMVTNDWQKQSCRVELVKAGRSLDEIKELCK